MAKFDGIIEQTTHYYLYNGTLAYSTNQGVQKYKYNGKKLDRTHGLDWYDYGASQYDPASGRFTSMDPFCEKYYNINPYMYCAGKHSNKLRQLDQKKQIKNQKISNDYLKELEILLTLQIISSIFLLYRNAEKNYSTMLLDINAYRIVSIKGAALMKCGIPLLFSYVKVG